MFSETTRWKALPTTGSIKNRLLIGEVQREPEREGGKWREGDTMLCCIASFPSLSVLSPVKSGSPAAQLSSSPASRCVLLVRLRAGP